MLAHAQKVCFFVGHSFWFLSTLISSQDRAIFFSWSLLRLPILQRHSFGCALGRAGEYGPRLVIGSSYVHLHV